MIRSLRQRHGRMVIGLGIFLPIAFAVGIAARKPVPGVARLPAALAAVPEQFFSVEWEKADLFTNPPMRVRLLREQRDAGHFAIELSAPKDLVKPDLIVYWTSGDPRITNAVPDDALLLGAFKSGMALPLPPDDAGGEGVLVLYSLADHEIVETSRQMTFRN